MMSRSLSAARAWVRAGLVGAAALYATAGWAQTVDCMAAATPVSAVDMRLLVVTADGTEAVLPAIKQVLDYVGIPYDTFVGKNQTLTSANLCSASGTSGHGRYQGVLLTTGNLGFYNASSNSYMSAFTSTEWSLLWAYGAKYHARQATFYTIGGGWPDTYGLNPPSSTIDTTTSPLTLTLTATSPAGSGNPSGQQLFSYLKPAAKLVLQNAYAYLSTPATGAALTPLLVDSQGHAVASINNYADGHQNLAVTVDANPYLLHAEAMGYGIVNWVTKGLFVGQRKVYMSPEPDDVLIDDDIWSTTSLTDQAGLTYRITGTDYQRYISWQNNENQKFPGNRVVLEIPFNGYGTSPDFDQTELYPATTDNLTPAIRANSSPFTWLSHTYDHLNLDAATYADTMAELTDNDTVARTTLALRNYSRNSMITPDVSGLNNTAALQAMRDYGIRYVVSNTSLYCGNRDATPRPCPTPNVGIYDDLMPSILMIPRYPANLYYNVYTPAQWTSEYNFIYYSYFGKNLTMAQILDNEANIWLRYLVTYDVRPVMFHQPNMAAYDGSHSLLGNLIDATLTKYAALFNLPVVSLPLNQIGALMVERMNLNAALAPASGSPLVATIVPGTASSSIVVTNPTSKSVVVPITGVVAGSTQTYGGQSISRVTVPANGGTATITGAPVW